MRIESIERPHRGLRLAPLVDVVFLLLIFFMLVARLDATQNIAIEPPSRGTAGALHGAVLIRLDSDGGLDVNGLPVALDDLGRRIATFLERDADTRILVQPAYEAPLDHLVGVVDRLRTAGADDFRLLQSR